MKIIQIKEKGAENYLGIYWTACSHASLHRAQYYLYNYIKLKQLIYNKWIRGIIKFVCTYENEPLN